MATSAPVSDAALTSAVYWPVWLVGFGTHATATVRVNAIAYWIAMTDPTTRRPKTPSARTVVLFIVPPGLDKG